MEKVYNKQAEIWVGVGWDWFAVSLQFDMTLFNRRS
jgi:hypothetical protein